MKKKLKSTKLRNVLAVIILIIGIIAALYVGLWVMFIKPIITIAMAIDGHTITAMLIAISILKIIFASIVSAIILLATKILSALVSPSWIM